VLACSGYAWLHIVQALAVLAETPSPLGLRVALAEAHHHAQTGPHEPHYRTEPTETLMSPFEPFRKEH
jgi:hypothetical protein